MAMRIRSVGYFPKDSDKSAKPEGGVWKVYGDKRFLVDCYESMK
jgi:hypothetical protein